MQPQNALLSATGTTIFPVMSALANQHQAINLGQGFPDYDGPEDVVRAAAEALLDGRNQYPPMTGLPELRNAVAAHNKRFYGLEVDPNAEVIVTSGATEALTACLMAVLNPGDECVLIEPLYDTYLPVVKLLGAVSKLVRLSPPNWELPRAELAAAFGPKTKAILFNTPMNPAGKVFTAAELAFLADLIQRHDCYAICDEVYEHLTFDGWKHIPLMTLPGMRERCMRIGSAGKTFSLTGWKVGYITTDRSGRLIPPDEARCAFRATLPSGRERRPGEHRPCRRRNAHSATAHPRWHRRRSPESRSPSPRPSGCDKIRRPCR